MYAFISFWSPNNASFCNTPNSCTCRSLRKTVHAKLLINLCFALVGLYVTFFISTFSTGVPVLCGLVSALMHYFFLAVFFWMAAESIHLHRKLVTVFKPDVDSYIAIAMAICWGELVQCGSGLYTSLHVLFVSIIIIQSLEFYCSYSGSSLHCHIFPCSTISELHSLRIVSSSLNLHTHVD